MRQLRRARWLDRPLSASARTVIARLQALARAAARRRDADRLVRLQSALHFAAGGHTAGEQALLIQLAEASDPELEQAIGGLPAPEPVIDAVHCRLTGLLVFAP